MSGPAKVEVTEQFVKDVHAVSQQLERLCNANAHIDSDAARNLSMYFITDNDGKLCLAGSTYKFEDSNG